MTTPVFQVESLTRRFGSHTVLDHLDFSVLAGECLVILGRSGSGKSVTLRHLNGLERPDEGSVRFEGQEITDLPEEDLFPLRRRVGMLFQGAALFDSMDVFDNIAFPLREHTELSPDEIAERVLEKLSMVQLEGVESDMPAALSGGMKKRVALARSLALDPDVVLYDEPTTGLDPVTSANIAHLINDTQETLGVTSVVVTHDLVLARIVAERLAFLENGHFRFVGTWEEADRCTDASLCRFLAGEREIQREL